MFSSINRPFVQLSNEDGNAFSILGRCQREARREGISNEEIQQFLSEATSGDYDHLLQTVMAYFETA